MQEMATRQGLANRAPGPRPGAGSTWQSLARGAGSIEVDFLNGEITLLGRLHGVPTPANETLQVLADRMAREQQAPGSISPDEVRAEIAKRETPMTGSK
jgi:2-dehydropantoate 2-reductase